MIWWIALLVAGAGGAGAVLRYAVDAWLTARTGGRSPWGTLAVNTTGALALGVLVGLGERVAPGVMLVVGGGLLGAYTTFSTWMVESVRLIEEGRPGAAVVNLAGSVGLGVMAAGFGVAIGMGA